MNPSLQSVAPALPSDDRGAPEAAPDQHTRLLGLAERLPELAREYAAVVELPEDVEVLRRMVLDQHGELVRMALWLERMTERLERTERRLRRLERRP